MKKLLISFAAVVLVLGINTPVRAALITITFDEPGITSGPTSDRYDGTQIDDEYSGIGVTWEDTLTADALLTGQGVTLPNEFSGDWPDTDQMLWYYGSGLTGTTPVDAEIMLTFSANSLSFEYRRPKNTGTMDVLLYMGDTLVYNSGPLSLGYVWDTFTHTGDTFDRVNILADDKFVSDNYSFNTIPIPSAFWLLGSSLILLICRRIRN